MYKFVIDFVFLGHNLFRRLQNLLWFEWDRAGWGSLSLCKELTSRTQAIGKEAEYSVYSVVIRISFDSLN